MCFRPTQRIRLAKCVNFHSKVCFLLFIFLSRGNVEQCRPASRTTLTLGTPLRVARNRKRKFRACITITAEEIDVALGDSHFQFMLHFCHIRHPQTFEIFLYPFSSCLNLILFYRVEFTQSPLITLFREPPPL